MSKKRLIEECDGCRHCYDFDYEYDGEDEYPVVKCKLHGRVEDSFPNCNDYEKKWSRMTKAVEK